MQRVRLPVCPPNPPASPRKTCVPEPLKQRHLRHLRHPRSANDQSAIVAFWASIIRRGSAYLCVQHFVSAIDDLHPQLCPQHRGWVAGGGGRVRRARRFAHAHGNLTQIFSTSCKSCTPAGRALAQRGRRRSAENLLSWCITKAKCMTGLLGTPDVRFRPPMGREHLAVDRVAWVDADGDHRFEPPLFVGGRSDRPPDCAKRMARGPGTTHVALARKDYRPGRACR